MPHPPACLVGKWELTQVYGEQKPEQQWKNSGEPSVYQICHVLFPVFGRLQAPSSRTARPSDGFALAAFVIRQHATVWCYGERSIHSLITEANHLLCKLSTQWALPFIGRGRRWFKGRQWLTGRTYVTSEYTQWQWQVEIRLWQVCKVWKKTRISTFHFTSTVKDFCLFPGLLLN